MVLTLEWKPHSGLDLFTSNPKGQVPAAKLRELFSRYREGPAKLLLPSYPSNPRPEMVCYGPSNGHCRCLYFEDRGRAVFGPVGSPEKATFSRENMPFENTHTHERHSLFVFNDVVSTMRRWPGGAGGSPNPITTYERHIPLFTTAGDDRPNPSHAWLHALDPNMCSRKTWVRELPLCKDEDCMNYYRRLKESSCVSKSDTLHHACICDTWEYIRAQVLTTICGGRV